MRTELEELPERAEVIEYSNTIIDSGEGPKLCGGAIMTSYPPQCFGPVIVGLDMSDWAEFASGVSFGERTVVVTWPAVDDRVQHISDSEFEPAEPPYLYAALPEHCAGIDRFVPTEALQQYSRSIGERSGGLVFTEGGVLFLQVTDDPEPHRAELGQNGREACVVQVGRSEAEVLRIQDDLFSQLRGDDRRRPGRHFGRERSTRQGRRLRNRRRPGDDRGHRRPCRGPNGAAHHRRGSPARPRLAA